MKKKFYHVKFVVLFNDEKKCTFSFDNIEANNEKEAHEIAYNQFIKGANYDYEIILKRQNKSQKCNILPQ